jgi:hypothetical protein
MSQENTNEPFIRLLLCSSDYELQKMVSDKELDKVFTYSNFGGSTKEMW